MKRISKIIALFKLLNDENEKIANIAINELLSEGKVVEKFVKKFQESPNVYMRKRIHQLQTIIKTRKSRTILKRRFQNKYSGLWSGLQEIHLLWYDKESKDLLEADFEWLISKFVDIVPSSKNFASTMKRLCFVVSINGDIDPDFYCIGSIINSKIGADFMLCALMVKVASYFNWEYEIICKDFKYFLLGQDNTLTDPYTWEVKENINISEYKSVSTGDILKLAAHHLFLSAVASDSHRYIYSIAKSIFNDTSDKNFLPYPFNTKD